MEKMGGIRTYKKELARQEKILKEVAGALPMALDPAFCQRVINETQQAIVYLRKEIKELERKV